MTLQSKVTSNNLAKKVDNVPLSGSVTRKSLEQF